MTDRIHDSYHNDTFEQHTASTGEGARDSLQEVATGSKQNTSTAICTLRNRTAIPNIYICH